MADPNIQETQNLVASDEVVGTEVYDNAGEHIGEIKRLILEKRSGQVSYAVLSFGGFLGMGEDYYPLPWKKLSYDESLDGFRIDITKQQVEGAPKFAEGDDYDWSPENGRAIDSYYGYGS